MPAVSYDGQSFMVDGRRVWLVSGAIHYPRTPRGQWRQRIRAAKQAGLNCIETYVFWNLHENEPGEFDWEGDKDLRAFVQMIGQEGMYCMLRPGPYVCSEWDFGGLPAWLNRIRGQPGVKLRQADPVFLEASARYLGQVLEQVRDLQVTSTASAQVATTHQAIGGGNGPIIMMQAENEWFCHNPRAAETYLKEIVRYLRENGCDVPINMCNNLWQRLDGTIDTWNASGHLSDDLRQLHVVQPNAPRIVTEYWPGWFDQWDGPHASQTDASLLEYRQAAMLAVGAQYNFYMFHGGTNFAFWGGRTVANPACFMTTSYDYDAPLLEAGGRGEKYLAAKRVSVFASQFGQVFASLDPDNHHAAVALTETDHLLSVIQQTGTQGAVVFLFKSKADTTQLANVLLPNGLRLPVPLGDDRVAWIMVDTNLGGVAELSYTNLRPWAFVGKRMLVLFGPAKAAGMVAINGARFSVTVPQGRVPEVHQHEGMTLVVLNREQVDAAYVLPDGLVVGAQSLDLNDKPVPLPGWSSMTTIALDGKLTTSRAKASRAPIVPRLAHWQQSRLMGLINGDAEAYRPIDAPATLEELGCNYGYGWYRFDLRSAGGGMVLAAQSADRVHLYQKGKFKALLGLAAGAEFDPVRISASGRVTALVDNLGRMNYGWRVGEKKGLWGHFHKVKPKRLGPPKVVSGKAPDPFELSQYWTNLRAGEHGPADALVWHVQPAGRNPLILDFADVPATLMILVNGKPVDMYDRGKSAHFGRWVLEVGKELRAGRNELKLALFEKLADAKRKAAIVKGITLYQSQGALTDKGDWLFAPLSVPAAEAFGSIVKSAPSQPCWYRASFNVSSAAVPLWFEPRGLSKGQLYLNGHNVGRYFVATHTGKKVPPQERYYLPEAWLKTDGPNELLIFEEHGKSPTSSKLVYDPMGPYNG
ncbi:MAG: beta-galactosidase [Phycisphaeraceae bacterium]